MARRPVALALALCACRRAAAGEEAAGCPAEAAAEAEESEEVKALNVELLQARAPLTSRSNKSSDAGNKTTGVGNINHYAEDCYGSCGGAGICESWCGTNNACCRQGYSSDPEPCQGVKFWPAVAWHTCVQPAYIQKAMKKWCGPYTLSDNWNTGEDVETFTACQEVCNTNALCHYISFGNDWTKGKNRCATFKECKTQYDYNDGEINVYEKNPDVSFL